MIPGMTRRIKPEIMTASTKMLAMKMVKNLLKASPNASEKESSAPVRIDLTRMGYVAPTNM